MTALDDIQLNARRCPEVVALIDVRSGRRWTYAEADHWTGKLCAGLSARRLCAGDRVALLASNRAATLLLHAACARLGLLLVPLNYRLAARELSQVLLDAEPTLLLAEPALTEGIVHEWLDYDDFLAECEVLSPLTPAVRPSPDEPSLILYTSGSTGLPKGVLISERNADATAWNFGRLAEVDRSSVFLCEAPMFHVIGLIVSARPALAVGGRLVVTDRFDTARTLSLLEDPAWAITHYMAVPQVAQRLRAHPDFDPQRLVGLKGLFVGGAPMPAEQVIRWLDDGIPLVAGFGMTEAGTVFGMPLDPRILRERAGFCGLATPLVETRIVDEAGRICMPGEQGEVQVRGDNVTSGYFRRPDATAEAFTPDGFLRTGDIGVADSDGYYRLLGRRKEMYISGGENVFPGEVEAQVVRIQGVEQCAVIGVPDGTWGEAGHLFVVLERPESFDAEALLVELGQHLARYKLPKYVTSIAALPIRGTGKVDAAALLELHRRSLSFPETGTAPSGAGKT